MTAVIMIFNLIPAIGVSASMNIQIGEYVQMGTYYGKPILWRCVDIDENGPLMLSDKIICIKPYDASGTNTSGSHGRGYYSDGTQGYSRQRFGSNYWADSNMRCWLNSTATAGNVVWACGNPPDESHVWKGYNEYDDEAGFLTNFTQSERNAMKTVTQKSLLDGFEYSTGLPNTRNSNYHRKSSLIGSVVQNYDTAFSEQVTDTMFLLDVKQVNEVYNNRSILGSDYYIGEPTAECVANSEYTSSSLATEKNWNYWLRSPYADGSSRNVSSVRLDGSVDCISAYYGSMGGVRPAFYLNLSSASVSGGAGTLNSPYTVVGGSKESYNDRENASDKVSITVVKNNKDMTDSADEYVEHITASFPKNSKTNYELTGYYKEEINTSDLSDGDKVYLEKSGMNVPVLRGVYLGGKDVRRDELIIHSDFAGELTAEIDWNGQKEKIAYIDNGITQIKLTDGKTDSDVNWGNFIYNSRGTYIVLKTVNGYTTKKKLNILLLIDSNTPDEIELNVFDSITDVGSGVLPYLDDLELSFDIPNFKLDFSVDPADNSIKGVFGVDVAEWAYENNLRDDKAGKWEDSDRQNAYKTVSELMKDTFKEMQKNKKDQKTLAQEYKKLTKQLGKAKQKTTAKFGFDAGIEVMGYVEGKVDHDGFYLSEGGIIIKASVAGSVSGEGVIWVIPYNWKLGGSAEANLNLQLAQREIRAEKLTPQGSIAITIGANGEGGPGLKKVHLNLGIAGSLTPAWQFAPDSVFTLDGNFSIYIDATAWAWSFKKDLFETSYRFYPRAKTMSLMSIDDVYNTDTYSLRERKYADIPSEFVANDSGIMLFSFDEHEKADKIIKTNSYDVSTPQYVKLTDGRELLVWLDDDTSRTVINGTSIMYSINDGEKWSEPLYVENDGSGDYSPELKTVGNEVYLVWEDIDVQADDATMEESLKAMDIKCARFDAGNNVFTDILQLTDDTVMDSTPEIGVSDGDLVVTWIKNTSDNMFETGNTYSINYAVVSGGEVTQQSTAVTGSSSIDSHIAELKDGAVNVYYIYDTDDVLSNVTDNILATTKGTLSVDGNVSGLCSFDDVIYYYSNGKIATGGEDIGVSVQNNNYCITNNGKTVLYTAQGDMTSDIYAQFYDEEQSAWGEAVRLTNLGCKITDINGYSDENGEIHLAFNKKNLAESGADSFYSTSDLAVLSIAPSYNVTLKDVYTENSNLLPGKEATLHIEVYNAGERTVDTLVATIYDSEGNILSESEIEASLLSGVTGEYDITYTLSDDFSPSEITVEVNPKGKEDYNTSDNSMELMIDFNNLVISGINSVATEDGYSINAIITNTGFSTESDIEVSLLKDGEVVEMVEISNLDSLESKNIVFSSVLANTEYVVKITEKDNEDIWVDNEEKIVVTPNAQNYDTDGYIKELSYADDKITAQISMFNAYEASTAYLALYNSAGTLTGIDYKSVKTGEKSFEMTIEKELSDTENYTVKFMLWDGNMKPFIETDVRDIVTQKTIVMEDVLELDYNYENSTNKTYTYTYENG